MLIVWSLKKNMLHSYGYSSITLFNFSEEGLYSRAGLLSVSVIVDGAEPSQLDYDY